MFDIDHSRLCMSVRRKNLRERRGEIFLCGFYGKAQKGSEAGGLGAEALQFFHNNDF